MSRLGPDRLRLRSDGLSLERLELGILAHARYEHPDACSAVLADPDSPERQALRERIAAAAHEVAVA